MRHDDQQGTELVTDVEHLMVMNAGSGFRHEERTLADDPPLRMLQIFVRPHSLDLPPQIQHEPIDDPVVNEWQHLFDLEELDAPLYVRNDVHFYDVHLEENSSVDLPSSTGWDTYFYVFDGAVTANDTYFDETESGLLVDEGGTTVTAQTDTLSSLFSSIPKHQSPVRGQ